MILKTLTSTLLIFLFVSISTIVAQNAQLDSLNSILETDIPIDHEIELLIEIAMQFQQTNPDTLVTISKLAFDKAVENNLDSLMLTAAIYMGGGYLRSGSYPESLEQYDFVQNFIESNESDNYQLLLAHALRGIGNINFIQFNQEVAIQYYEDIIPIYQSYDDSSSLSRVYDNMASAYLELKEMELAEE